MSKTIGQGSIKVIESGTIRQTGYGFLIVFCSNFVPKTYRFWDIQLMYSDLETQVMGHSRSSKMISFDRPWPIVFDIEYLIVSM